MIVFTHRIQTMATEALFSRRGFRAGLSPVFLYQRQFDAASPLLGQW